MERLALGYHNASFLIGFVLTSVDWPDALPPSPNFLRLIYGGKLLPDKSTLAGTLLGVARILIHRMQYWSR